MKVLLYVVELQIKCWRESLQRLGSATPRNTSSLELNLDNADTDWHILSAIIFQVVCSFKAGEKKRREWERRQRRMWIRSAESPWPPRWWKTGLEKDAAPLFGAMQTGLGGACMCMHVCKRAPVCDCVCQKVVFCFHLWVFAHWLFCPTPPPGLSCLSRWGCKYHRHAEKRSELALVTLFLCLFPHGLNAWAVAVVHPNSINLLGAVTSCKTVGGWSSGEWIIPLQSPDRESIDHWCVSVTLSRL